MQTRPLSFRGAIATAFLLASLSLTASAQDHGPGGPPPGGPPAGDGPPNGSGMHRHGHPGLDYPSNHHGSPPPGASSQASGAVSTMRGGLQLGPPGRWWDDSHFAQDLHLRPEQQKRMDSIFEENRGNLVSRYTALQQEESRMEALSRAQNPNEPELDAQIDRVSRARADLEKANTRLLLQIRRQMDADQIARLEEHR